MILKNPWLFLAGTVILASILSPLFGHPAAAAGSAPVTVENTPLPVTGDLGVSGTVTLVGTQPDLNFFGTNHELTLTYQGTGNGLVRTISAPQHKLLESVGRRFKAKLAIHAVLASRCAIGVRRYPSSGIQRREASRRTRAVVDPSLGPDEALDQTYKNLYTGPSCERCRTSR
jgi:hypothetical protein